MGVMKFKTAKFLEHLVVIIIDCGDKLFFVFLYRNAQFDGQVIKVLIQTLVKECLSLALLFLGLSAFANSELPRERRPSVNIRPFVF